MLNALSSTEKNESDAQSRNAPPTAPRAAAFDWIARTAWRIESSDVEGNVFSSCRTKNEPSSAWCTSPRSASDRKSSGTNERSAKYAIIAARWVPRSAKNLRTTRPTGVSMLACMDASQAIADLTEISPQVLQVAVTLPDGALGGSNLADEAAAERLVDGARRLLETAEELRPGVAQLEAATPEGSVFVVRDG